MVLANAAGRARLEGDGGPLLDTLRRCAAGAAPAGLLTTDIRGSGFPRHCLVVERRRAGARVAAARVEAAARRYRLTRREREVLALLLRGRTNKAMALALGCAESTVEVHVSSLLRKVGARSRAALIARVCQIAD